MGERRNKNTVADSNSLRHFLKSNRFLNKLNTLINVHNARSDEPEVFIFSTPRGGSTWLMELIATQPGFKTCNEPFNLRNKQVAKDLTKVGLSKWSDFYDPSKRPRMKKYINDIQKNRIRTKNPPFYRNHYRVFTHRIAFKFLHGGEDRINWLTKSFNSRAIVLLRHPIAVSLSRRYLPRLATFLNSKYSHHFNTVQLKAAESIATSGSMIEKGVLDWCLQNAPIINNTEKMYEIVTYEQLVVDPDPVVDSISKYLKLPYPELMVANLAKPSGSAGLSDTLTQNYLKKRSNAAHTDNWLVRKWRQQVDEHEEQRVMEILKIFDIDVYLFGNNLPSEKYTVRR